MSEALQEGQGTHAAGPVVIDRRRLVALVVLCVGPVRSYLHARSATQQLRVEVTQLDRKHAKLQAELKSASQTTAMIAQARAEGYIRPGEKPFSLTP